jgi:tetratricopeptide (TPR) repeat protein/predicted Ser/Thr protein kinase
MCGEDFHVSPTLAGAPSPPQEPLRLPRSDAEFREGTEITSRYRVVKLLGRGGMGAVYHVFDRELDREVALKVIRPELAESLKALERFKREIQLSSKVTHKNVLRVYDLGESGGVRFLTMQYVEGDSLAALLKMEGRLPVGRAQEIFRQICQGLGAAHEQGILHRDLKPQNILIDRAGTVFLSDFGLAKSFELSGMTESGTVLGTPYYMSPEQVKGDPIDARSDLYSLGIILYEMLTGQVPYSAGSAYEVMAQRLQRPPRPVRDLNPEVPSYLQGILNRCLVVDRDLRYSSTEQILSDLEAAKVRSSFIFEVRRRKLLRPALIWLFILLLAVGARWYYVRQQPAPAGSETPTGVEAAAAVAVVPFENRTGDRNLDWYGEGIARLIADNLAQSRHVRVMATDRVAALQKANPDFAMLAKAVAGAGARYLLTGEILAGPGGLTVAVRMSETEGGRVVGSKRMDGLGPNSLIGASDQVAVEVRKSLGIPPTEKVDVYAADFASKNPEAYESYLAGLRALLQFRYPEAEQGFSAALAKAPDYTMARYRLAYVHAITGRTEEALAEIHQAASESSRLSDREARYIRAAEAYYAREYDQAIKTYQDLISRYPYEMEARELLAEVYYETGRYAKAVEEAKIMSQLDPASYAPWSVLGEAHIAMRDFNQAILDLKRYVELVPNHPNAHHLLGDAYRSQGELDLAAEEYGKALALDPDFHFSTTALSVVDVLRGNSEDAERRLRGLAGNSAAMPRYRIDAAFDLASLLRSQGRFREAARALESLEKLLAAEKEREAMALSIRGVSLMEVGDLAGAARLIGRSIERNPGGPPTRYLFARGLLELRQKRLADVRKTAGEIMQGAPPREDPERKVEKAAAYLTGMTLLLEGKGARASEELSRAVTLAGYEYGIYRLGLAQAYLASGEVTQALAAARQSAAPPNPTEPRMDFQLDRMRALLLLAKIQAAMGRPAEAAAQARKFLDAWPRADAGVPDLAEARRLAAASN